MNYTLIKKIALYTICCFLTIIQLAFAQSIVEGKVLDAATKHPIPGASVYFNNTQIGEATNNNGVFKISAKRLYHDLVVSAVGYQTKVINIESNIKNYTILLSEKENSLLEVTVSAGKNDWKRWGSFFSGLLFGSDPRYKLYCKILNPEDVRFFYNENEHYLEATASKPILIWNSIMNCQLHIDLYQFVYSFNNDNILYSTLAYYDEFDNKPNKKRKMAQAINYLGSQMHFYRSLYTRTLEAENFQVYRYTSVKNLEREKVLKTVQQYKASKMAAGETLSKLADNPDSARYYERILKQRDILKWDTTRVDYKQFLTFDPVEDKMRFKFSDTLMVVYKRDEKMLEKLAQSSLVYKFGQPSVFTLKTLLFLNNKEGVVVDPAGFVTSNDLVMTGNMGNRRLAEQLPYDFVYSP
ncbi:carboxypeptidase-like regulatory domain-containing protein [Pedobacter vanadiisoli]|uniref:Carboxypeptidase-like regulatory domain-containing protein n=1 Tax=Pedobacter vanadiisoli TaxID=1761975 RepID=A0ABW5MLY8_9SPHI